MNRAHIHNHIIFNSTNLDCDRKFRDFWFSEIVLQRLSDIICLEHGLSIIPKVKLSERQKRTKYPERTSMRNVIREDYSRNGMRLNVESILQYAGKSRSVLSDSVLLEKIIQKKI